MSIPNINTLAKEVIPECLSQVKRKLREIILGMLGFDTTWADIKIMDGSSLIADIKASDEYKELKAQLLEEIKASMRDNPITIKELVIRAIDATHYRPTEESQ